MTFPFQIVPSPTPASAVYGVNFTDPRRLLRQTQNNGTIFVTAYTDGTDNSTSTTFWAEIPRRGVSVDSNFTASTYKALLSDNPGQGLVAGILGPLSLVAGETTTVEITNETGLYEIAIPLASGQRAYWGVSMGAALSPTGLFQGVGTGINAAKTIIDQGANYNVSIPAWNGIRTMGIPCLQYNSFLSIRMKQSVNVTSTTAFARAAGVIYMSQT